MEMFIRVVFINKNFMGMELINGKMEVHTKGNLLMEIDKGKAYGNHIMEISLKGIILMM